MEAMRYIQEVTSDTIVVKNLQAFKGQRVEIIILPYPENKPHDFNKYFGAIKEDIDGMEYQNMIRSEWNK